VFVAAAEQCCAEPRLVSAEPRELGGNNED